jgi:hypothetical protein
VRQRKELYLLFVLPLLLILLLFTGCGRGPRAPGCRPWTFLVVMAVVLKKGRIERAGERKSQGLQRSNEKQGEKKRERKEKNSFSPPPHTPLSPSPKKAHASLTWAT